MACSDSSTEKVEPVKSEAASEEKPAKKTEETKTSIEIGEDSVGITTKKGDKVEYGKKGAAVENKDVKVRVKRDTTKN